MRTLAVVGAVTDVQLLVHAEEDLREHKEGHSSASAVLASCRALQPCTAKEWNPCDATCPAAQLECLAQLTESIDAVSHCLPQPEPPPPHAHMTSGFAPKRLVRASSISLVSYVVLSLGYIPAASRAACTPGGIC